MIRATLAAACAAGAVLLFGLATVGLARLPDLYARSHAVSKGDTLGTALAVAAAALAGGDAVKLLALLAFVSVTTPTATHAVVRAADVEGYEPVLGAGDAGESSGTDGAGDRGEPGGTDGAGDPDSRSSGSVEGGES